MRLPSKPYSTLPIFSLGPSALQREESSMTPEKPPSSHHRPLRGIARFSSKSKCVDKSSEELQLPKELMEDWSTMEVCVDCKKFISEIISSSQHSLLLANKRARLKKKTQSFYMSSPGPSEYCPSERTINEIWAPCLSVVFVFRVSISTGEHWAGLSFLAVVLVNRLEFALDQVFAASHCSIDWMLCSYQLVICDRSADCSFTLRENNSLKLRFCVCVVYGGQKLCP